MVFPVVSWYLKVGWNFLGRSSQPPKVIAVPEMVFSWKVLAHIKANPSVMYKRANVIFFTLVL